MEESVSFSQSLLFFWVKGNVSIDEHTVKLHLRNCILDMIPAGSNEQIIPLRSINATTLSSPFKIMPVLFTVFWCICLYGVHTSHVIDPLIGSAVSLILTFLAASSFANGVTIALTIKCSGSNFIISIPFYENQKIFRIKRLIDEAMQQDGSNMQTSAAAQTAAPVDAMEKIK